ncbi:MAG: DUF4330 domain-containing protein [Bacillota bacterium]
MRFLDERGRVFGKISVVDLIIVLVLVVGAAWFAYAKFGRDLGAEIAAREEPARYTIIVPAVRPTTAEALAKGGKVFEFKTGAEIGTIKDVRSEPADIWSLQQDGRMLRVRTDDRVDAYVTVEAKARIGENTITVNGVEVRVGTTIGITTKWAQVNGNILTLELLGGSQ